MDSTDARHRWLPVLAVPLLGGMAALSSCADPCLDDGLGQMFCPEDDTSAMSGTETVDTGDTVVTGDGDPGTESSDTEACPVLDVILIPQIPTLQLLVDQSGSMDQDFGGDTRWNVIVDVLTNPQNGIVPQFESSIRFGLTLYTSLEGNMGGQCPMLTEVAPALDNYNAIDMTMSMSTPVQDTPTGESLDLTWQTLDAFPEPGLKYIVLATDGLPDTCDVPNPPDQMAQAMADAASVAAAEAAYAAGIPTFVISVGDQVGQAHLQDMANAGQGVGPNDPDATYYEALNQGALVDAFNSILAGVRSCRLDLMTPLTDEEAANCTLEVNGNVVDLGDANGWQLNNSMEVELLGTACDTLQGGTSSVQMECSC